jgi:hypothetical protein
VTWKNANEFRRSIRYLPEAERQRLIGEHRRLAARGLCTRCKVEPRSSTMSICKKCNAKRVCERDKRLKAERFHELKMKFVNDVLKHRCCLCREWLLDPLTRRGRIRYSCKSCYHELFELYKKDKTMKPFGYIRNAVRKLKIEAGILPKNAWETLKPRNTWERFWIEMGDGRKRDKR